MFWVLLPALIKTLALIFFLAFLKHVAEIYQMILT